MPFIFENRGKTKGKGSRNLGDGRVLVLCKGKHERCIDEVGDGESLKDAEDSEFLKVVPPPEGVQDESKQEEFDGPRQDVAEDGEATPVSPQSRSDGHRNAHTHDP